MSSFAIRPHFSEILEMNPAAAQARIVNAMESGVERCEVKTFEGFVCLRIPENERHFWSPRLTLSLESTEDGKTRIEGIYGPNANVWSLFLYGYLLSGTFGLFSGIYGSVQWSLKQDPWALWVFGVMMAIVIGLYVLAQFGQKVGVQQTFRLHQVFESAMGRPVEIH